MIQEQIARAFTPKDHVQVITCFGSFSFCAQYHSLKTAFPDWRLKQGIYSYYALLGLYDIWTIRPPVSPEVIDIKSCS